MNEDVRGNIKAFETLLPVIDEDLHTDRVSNDEMCSTQWASLLYASHKPVYFRHTARHASFEDIMLGCPAHGVRADGEDNG